MLWQTIKAKNYNFTVSGRSQLSMQKVNSQTQKGSIGDISLWELKECDKLTEVDISMMINNVMFVQVITLHFSTQ